MVLWYRADMVQRRNTIHEPTIAMRSSLRKKALGPWPLVWLFWSRKRRIECLKFLRCERE